MGRQAAPLEAEVLRDDGRFELRRRLGSGGFGTVFEAFDRKRNALVALKVLRDAAPKDLYRFKQEFRRVSGIIHPNLVTLYELASEGDRWFFSMELVRGHDFLAYVSGRDTEVDAATPPTPDPRDARTLDTGIDPVGPTLQSAAGAGLAPRSQRPVSLSPERLVAALRQLCRGLVALHAAGAIHRDVKPANVLCTPEGRVVLLDFGIAKDVAPERSEPSDAFIGTPHYMAPEQALGRRVGPAADWYGVGVLLYEALTGVLPFDGSAIEVLEQKTSRDPLPPCSLRPAIPHALDALAVELLDRRPERRPTGEAILRRLAEIEAELAPAPDAEDGALPRSLPREGPFVGRAAHLAEIAAAYAESREGRAAAVLCHGGSGAGKSTLCRRFLVDLVAREPEAVILAGRCYEHEDIPFKALDGVIDALSRFLARRARAEVEALLPRDAAALARLFPVLLQVPAVRAAAARRIADDLQARQAAFAALRDLLSAIAARRPLVLYVDDLQWGDPDGVSLLLEILRPPAPPPLLLVVAYRSEEAASSASLKILRQGLDGELGRAVVTRDLPVGELSAADAAELARTLLPEAERGRAAGIAAEASGNAFFVTELSRWLAEAPLDRAGSDGHAATLDALLRARAALLPPAPRRLLEVIAIAGQPVSRRTSSAAAYGDSAETDEPHAFALLRAARLVRVRHGDADEGADEDVVAYHDRVREAVVAGLDPEARRAIHLRLAHALEASGRAEPEQLVFHFRQGGDLAATARYAVQASAQAFAALAFHQAARLCRAALDTGRLSPDEAHVVAIRLADALARAGRPREAAEAYLALAEHEAPGMALQRRRQAAAQLFAGGYVPEGRRVVRELLTAVGLEVPKTALGRALTVLTFRALIALRGRGFRERAEHEVPAEDLLRIDTCDAVGAVGSADPTLSSTFRFRVVWYALRAGEPRRIAHALAHEARLHAARGAPAARVDALFSRAAALAERLGDPYTLGVVTYVEGHIAHLRGRFCASGAALDRAVEIFRSECNEAGADIDLMWTLRVYNLRWMGALRALRAELPPLLKDAIERGKQSQAVIASLVAGFLPALADDDPDRAEEIAREAERRIEGQPLNLQHVFLLEVRLLVLLYRGRGDAALALLQASQAKVTKSGQLGLEFFAMVWRGLRGLTLLAGAAAKAAATTRSRCSNARSRASPPATWASTPPAPACGAASGWAAKQASASPPKAARGWPTKACEAPSASRAS